MSGNAEIFDFLRTRFARLEERLDRIDTALRSGWSTSPQCKTGSIISNAA